MLKLPRILLILFSLRIHLIFLPAAAPSILAVLAGELIVANPDAAPLAIINPHTCRSIDSFAKTGARIICRVPASDLNAKRRSGRINCFKKKLKATECKDIQVEIKYKLINKEKDIDMEIVTNGGRTAFFFNDKDVTDDVTPALVSGTFVAAKSAAIFEYTTIINTCQNNTHVAKMNMKLRAVNGDPPTDRCAALDIIRFDVSSPSTSHNKKPKSSKKGTKSPKSM